MNLKIDNLKDAISFLENIKRITPKSDIKYLNDLIEDNNLLPNCKTIQVTGTNGKGSTCTYLSNILISNNKNVGLFISPYLFKFNERIQVNSIPIEDDLLLESINDFKSIYEQLDKPVQDKLSFFDGCFIVSLIVFKKYQLDYIIFEVGIGGGMDSTSSLNHDCLGISSIGYDHQKLLGKTLKEIATAKLSIVKPNNHLITTVSKRLFGLFNEYLSSKEGVTYKLIDVKKQALVNSLSPLNFNYDNLQFVSNLCGIFQINNICLAWEIAKYLIPDINVIDSLESITNTQFNGRFQKINDEPCVICDCAHNISAFKALSTSLSCYYPNKKIIILFSALFDKNPSKTVDYLIQQNYEIVLTSFKDVRFKELSQIALNNTSIINIPNFVDAFKYAYSKTDSNSVLLLTGSIHFLSIILTNEEITQYLNINKNHLD